MYYAASGLSGGICWDCKSNSSADGLWGRRVPHTAGYFNTILPFVISLDILLLVAEKFRKPRANVFCLALMSSKRLTTIMRRIDRTVLQKWRLPAALCVAFIVLLAFYLFPLDGTHLLSKYH
ncbi:hypothetical protein B0H13DRAFT_1970009, partial [Mycena leptocephala]